MFSTFKDEIKEELQHQLTAHKDEIKQEFQHQLGIQAESFQNKLDLVIEGHQMLSQKIDGVKTDLERQIGCVVRKLDTVAAQGDATAAKLDAVAADLKAHRTDTEAHPPPVYRIKE